MDNTKPGSTDSCYISILSPQARVVFITTSRRSWLISSSILIHFESCFCPTKHIRIMICDNLIYSTRRGHNKANIVKPLPQPMLPVTSNELVHFIWVFFTWILRHSYSSGNQCNVSVNRQFKLCNLPSRRGPGALRIKAIRQMVAMKNRIFHGSIEIMCSGVGKPVGYHSRDGTVM